MEVCSTLGSAHCPNEDADMDSMITTFNTAVTETASKILGKHRQKKKTLGYCRIFFFIYATKREN